jgi:flagellar basal body L-ring protein FlgH
MRTRLMTAAITAMTVAGVLTLNAQTPSPQSPQSQPPQAQQPQTQPPQPAQPAAQQPADRQTPDTQRPMTDTQRATTAGQTITITGCLQNEKDVAGLKPNPAERAGVTEDYILTNVKMSSSSTVSGIALATRYEIEGIDKTELKKHVNHQVELTGTITQPTTTATDETPDFRGASLKMLSATCPAAQ